MSNPAITEAMVLDALRQVTDPELGLNIVDLGLIYGIQIDGSKVAVKMTLTTPGCPMAQSIGYGVRLALKKLPPVKDVDVEMVWEPRWTPDLMTDAGKAQVGMR